MAVDLRASQQEPSRSQSHNLGADGCLHSTWVQLIKRKWPKTSLLINEESSLSTTRSGTGSISELLTGGIGAIRSARPIRLISLFTSACPSC
jgi:hypothetical protein